MDDNNYTKLAFTENSTGGRFVEFWSETGGSRTGHGSNADLPGDFPTTIHLRLTNNGGTLTGAWSPNGETWTNINGTAPLKTGGTIGLLAAGDTDAQNKTAAFDYFRVTPDAGGVRLPANDEFDGSAIEGCRWDRIHGWNSNRIKLVDGKLRVTTFDADINGANNGPIENLLLQTPPEGDWVAETKMTAPLGDAWRLAGLMLFSDNDHYVKFDVVADNEAGAAKVRRVELRAENGGPLNGPGGEDIAPPASATDTWWLRLTKKGNTYTGAISADGTNWVQAPGSVTVALNNPALGLMAFGPGQAAPMNVDFEYFRVGAADSEAPTTTHTLTPAAADGQNGWYTSNPTLTLATEPGAGTQYKLGDGAFQPYTGPVTIEQAGTTTVTYRSTDAAGNVEADKTVTVKLDKAAPVTTATSSAQPGADGWYAGAPTITLTGADGGAGSGVASTQYAIDGGEWQTYTEPFAMPVGEHTLRYRSTDRAGLAETAKEAVLRVRVQTTQPGTIGGTVPSTLSLTLGTAAGFGAFTPGVCEGLSREHHRERDLDGR